MFEDVKHPQFLSSDWKPLAHRWYCCHCVDAASPTLANSGWATDSGVKAHAKATHLDGDDPQLGVDYAEGMTMAKFLQRWRLQNESVILGFERVMQSIIGPDDLLFEAGA